MWERKRILNVGALEGRQSQGFAKFQIEMNVEKKCQNAVPPPPLSTNQSKIATDQGVLEDKPGWWTRGRGQNAAVGQELSELVYP